MDLDEAEVAAVDADDGATTAPGSGAEREHQTGDEHEAKAEEAPTEAAGIRIPDRISTVPRWRGKCSVRTARSR